MTAADDRQRRKSVYNFGGTDIEEIGESASAESAKLRLPKARSPSRLGGLRLRPRRRRDFEHFMPKFCSFLDLLNLRLFYNKIEK